MRKIYFNNKNIYIYFYARVQRENIILLIKDSKYEVLDTKYMVLSETKQREDCPHKTAPSCGFIAANRRRERVKIYIMRQ